MNKTILIYSGEGAISIIRTAYAKVFQSLGWKVIFHNPKSKEISILDLWNRNSIDIWMGGVYEINRPTLKAMLARPNLDVILWCPNLETEKISAEKTSRGVLMAGDNDKKIVEELLKAGLNIRYAITYYHQNRVEQTHGEWRNYGLEPLGIHLASDIFNFNVGEMKDEFKSDVCFIGGHWKLKGENLDRFLYPLCSKDDLNVKIFGYGDWAVAQSLGTIVDENMRHAMRSAVVCPNIFEGHSVEWGDDINERGYKILSSGGLCISQRVESAEKDVFTNNEMVFVDTPEEMQDLIYHFKYNPGDRLPYIQSGFEYTKKDGTYFHRTRDLASAFGWINEVVALNQIIGNL